jgi:hypothetical protein
MTHSPMLKAPLTRFAKRAALGRMLYRTYHQPRAFLSKCWQQGVVNLAIDYQANQQMEQATYALKPIQTPPTPGVDLHFLTGKRFWYQTCFCAYSMAKYTEQTPRPVLYDDGSLEQIYQDAFRTVFPNAIIIPKAELDDRINTHLPESRFPYLRERRQNYPNLRKLTDIHVGSQGWKLVLDSDMLFFRKPQFLLDWLQNPQQPCHMVDTETSYGYPLELMASLAGGAIAERLNVGICGLQSESIDWEQLEYWCKILIEQHGTHYYQEQALIAMLMATQNPQVAPEEDYIVLPEKSEVIKPQAVLHHYVADSKSWYFRYGWKHCQ